ncbi:MAG TPA: hypothetical protein PLI09_04640 [Candidatus Hydrogenedentes bacterium]|nr:hypothetical protein [Candidatus Hydrogenedentota bacterium]
MRTWIRYSTGNFQPSDLKRYFVFMTVVFWGLIAAAYLSYPRENHFTIMTHSFSYLGSFDPEHNPKWWPIFSVAMTFWGLSTVPLVFYLCRRFSAISRPAARIGASQLLLGCLGIILVGVIPTGHGIFIGTWDWGLAHRNAGLMVAITFNLGIFLHEILLFIDKFTRRHLGRYGYWRFVWPYTFWWSIVFLAAYFLTKWVFVYEDMKKAAAVAGRTLEGSWSEALNTRYSIPLWENILVVTLFVFMIWLVARIPWDDLSQSARNTERQ